MRRAGPPQALTACPQTRQRPTPCNADRALEPGDLRPLRQAPALAGAAATRRGAPARGGQAPFQETVPKHRHRQGQRRLIANLRARLRPRLRLRSLPARRAPGPAADAAACPGPCSRAAPERGAGLMEAAGQSVASASGGSCAVIIVRRHGCSRRRPEQAQSGGLAGERTGFRRASGDGCNPGGPRRQSRQARVLMYVEAR
jgi:hypothetical protein